MIDKDREHSKFKHVYAVVRIDSAIDQDNPENSPAVVKVFASRAAAE